MALARHRHYGHQHQQHGGDKARGAAGSIARVRPPHTIERRGGEVVSKEVGEEEEEEEERVFKDDAVHCLLGQMEGANRSGRWLESGRIGPNRSV